MKQIQNYLSYIGKMILWLYVTLMKTKQLNIKLKTHAIV